MVVAGNLLSNHTNQLSYPYSSRFEFVTSWLNETLAQHRINTDAWGSGAFKSFDHLRDEILNGESQLESIGGRLHRVCSIVRLDVRFSISDASYLKLIEAEQIFSDGRRRERVTDFAIWEKLNKGEDPDSAVVRAINEELGIEIDNSRIVFRGAGMIEGCHQDYPGLPSRLSTVDYDLLLSPAQFNRSGYVEQQFDKATFFQWKAA